MPEIIILGGNSTLAQKFSTLYPIALNLPRNKCDINNSSQIQEIFASNPPSYILNCAALTDIDFCEKNPNQCFTTNTKAVSLIGKLASKYNHKLIHISSNYAVNPQNIYGWSKYFSEKLLNPKHLIIRTSFYSPKTYILKNLLNKKQVHAYTNVFINPISLGRFCREIYQNKKTNGILNIFSNDKITWYDFAQKVAAVLKLDPQTYILKGLYHNTPSNPQRPLNSYLKTDIKIDINTDLLEFKKSLDS